LALRSQVTGEIHVLMLVVTLVTVICTALAVIISYKAYREAHGDRNSIKRDAAVRQAVVSGTAEVTQKLALLDERMTGFHGGFNDKVQSLVERALKPTDIRLAQVETKVDLFKEQLALAMAQILHQPDPTRAEVDSLLESFMEGTISPDDLSELRRHLDQIRNWEPGQPSPYPIHPGEQVAAAILLNTMDTALAVRGHRNNDKRP
jgi:hypothetical protein